MTNDIIRAKIEYGTIESLPHGKHPGQIRVIDVKKSVGRLIEFSFAYRRRICLNGLTSKRELTWVPVDGTFNNSEVVRRGKVAFERKIVDGKSVVYWAVPADYEDVLTLANSDHYAIFFLPEEGGGLELVWQGLYKENLKQRADLAGAFPPRNLDGCIICYEEYGEFWPIEDPKDCIQRFELLQEATVLQPNQQKTKTGRRAV